MKLPDLKSVYTAVFAIFAMCWLVDAGAHHSFSRFDASRMVEVEGELLSFSWRNPHIRFKIREINETGDEVVWDPLSDTAAPGCKPKGMPLIMEQPYPLEFVQGDNVVLIRLEEYDTVRTVHMNLASAPLDLQRSLLGFSTGHWDDDILAVTTAGVDYAYFDPNGTPQRSDPSFIERFRVSDDGSCLLYELTATDDEVFTESVTVTRDWVWRPGEQVRPYECVQW